MPHLEWCTLHEELFIKVFHSNVYNFDGSLKCEASIYLASLLTHFRFRMSKTYHFYFVPEIKMATPNVTPCRNIIWFWTSLSRVFTPKNWFTEQKIEKWNLLPKLLFTPIVQIQRFWLIGNIFKYFWAGHNDWWNKISKSITNKQQWNAYIDLIIILSVVYGLCISLMYSWPNFKTRFYQWNDVKS